MSQEDIARQLGLAGSTLSSYLSGTRVPSGQTALRLSRELGIPLETLLAPAAPVSSPAERAS